jgi:hypothetical protein
MVTYGPTTKRNGTCERELTALTPSIRLKALLGRRPGDLGYIPAQNLWPFCETPETSLNVNGEIQLWKTSGITLPLSVAQ